jgi:hypothetical protein
MDELAVREAWPPPADLPHGEFACTRLADGRIRIDRADPRILISGELLDAIALQQPLINGTEALQLNAWLDTTGCMPPPARATYAGAVLKISGAGQQVIYRIGEYVPRVHGYIGEWPD